MTSGFRMRLQLQVISTAVLVGTILVSSTTNITDMLGKDPSYSLFNSLLSQTSIATEINSLKTARTVLAMQDSVLSPVVNSATGKMGLIADVLRYHVLLRYLDIPDMFSISSSGSLVKTLYYERAKGVAGSLNVTVNKARQMHFILPGAADGIPSANLVKKVASAPPTVSILEIDHVLIPVGVDLGAGGSSSASRIDLIKVLEQASEFSILTKLLNSSGMASMFAIKEAGTGITVLAPTDDAFYVLPNGTLTELLSSNTLIVSVLQYHALTSYFAFGSLQALSNTVTVATLESGKGGNYTLNVSSSNGTVSISTGQASAQISRVLYDKPFVAMYAVDRVLIPAGILLASVPGTAPITSPIRAPTSLAPVPDAAHVFAPLAPVPGAAPVLAPLLVPAATGAPTVAPFAHVPAAAPALAPLAPEAAVAPAFTRFVPTFAPLAPVPGAAPVLAPLLVPAATGAPTVAPFSHVPAAASSLAPLAPEAAVAPAFTRFVPISSAAPTFAPLTPEVAVAPVLAPSAPVPAATPAFAPRAPAAAFAPALAPLRPAAAAFAPALAPLAAPSIVAPSSVPVPASHEKAPSPVTSSATPLFAPFHMHVAIPSPQLTAHSISPRAPVSPTSLCPSSVASVPSTEATGPIGPSKFASTTSPSRSSFPASPPETPSPSNPYPAPPFETLPPFPPEIAPNPSNHFSEAIKLPVHGSYPLTLVAVASAVLAI